MGARQNQLLATDQRQDDREVEKIDRNTGRERRSVVAEMVVEDSGEPTAGRHPTTAAQEQRRYAPGRLVERKQLLSGKDRRRDHAAETQTEGRRNGEQPDFVLREQEGAHR